MTYAVVKKSTYVTTLARYHNYSFFLYRPAFVTATSEFTQNYIKEF
jgi:hypothetical protein